MSKYPLTLLHPRFFLFLSLFYLLHSLALSPTHLHTPPSHPELTGPESGQTALDNWTEGEKKGNHKKSGKNTKTHKPKYTEGKGINSRQFRQIKKKEINCIFFY